MINLQRCKPYFSLTLLPFFKETEILLQYQLVIHNSKGNIIPKEVEGHDCHIKQVLLVSVGAISLSKLAILI